MNQFLQEILNPIPGRKRRSQTDNNCQVRRKVGENQRDRVGMRFENMENLQSGVLRRGNQQEIQQEWQRQQVVECQYLNNQEGHLNNQEHLVSVDMRQQYVDNQRVINGDNKESIIEKIQSQHNDSSYYEVESFSYERKLLERLNDKINKGKDTQVVGESMEESVVNVSEGVVRSNEIRNVKVDELIEGMNIVREYQFELMNRLMGERQQIEFMIRSFSQGFEQKCRQVIGRLREEHRRQIESLMNIQGRDRKQQRVQRSVSSLSQQQKWQIEKKLIREELEQRYQYRIQKLQQELDEKRQYEQEILRKPLSQGQMSEHQQDGMKTNQKLSQKQPLQRVTAEMEQLRVELEQKNRLIIQLQMENERLNQHIFDIEQKISGIELQVQNKVRERLSQIQSEEKSPSINVIQQPIELNPILQASSQLQQSTKLFGMQSVNVRFDQLVGQNQALQRKINQILEQKSLIQNQLKEHQKIISFREEQIKQNQQDIHFEWAQIEKEKHNLLLREQELVTAEENISQKISEIRYKEGELEKWQNTLQKRQLNLQLKEEQIKRNLDDLVMRQNQFKTEKQLFNKQKQTYNNIPHNIKSRKNIHQYHTEDVAIARSNDVQTSQIPNARKYYQQQEYKQLQKSFQNQYQFRNKLQMVKNNLERSYDDIEKSYTRHFKERERDRDRPLLTGNNFRSQQRQNHQFVLPQSSKPTQQSRSKSRSKEKIMLRSNFNPSSGSIGYKNVSFKPSGRYGQQVYQNKVPTNLDGLGSKLQRLRDEIKREIDSIK